MSAATIYDTDLGQDVFKVDTAPLITSPEAGATQFMELGMATADVEECWALMLTTRHRLIEAVMVSRGSIDHTFMSPREVYRAALGHNAAAVVLGHNHPSGDPNPSRDDERVTRRLSEAGELIGVDLLDHIVIGSNGWTSLARRGAV